MKRGKISERISVGGQPTEDDLKLLKAEGIEAVINLRRDGEQNQPLDPAQEGAVVKAAGLKYFHIPVDSADPKREQVQAVQAALAEAKGKVFVHCQGGGRACTMALLASEPDASPDQMMKQADGAGFPVTNPVTQQFIKDVLGKS
jgi:uncharacterized protein (TIGR01244 family)